MDHLLIDLLPDYHFPLLLICESGLFLVHHSRPTALVHGDVLAGAAC